MSSIKTSSNCSLGSRRLFFLKKNPLRIKITQSFSNIFDLTTGKEDAMTEISASTVDLSPSYFRAVTFQSDASSPSKVSVRENPEKKFKLPMITESTYNFNSGIEFPKIPRKPLHGKEPKYMLDLETVDSRNLKRMKLYQKRWKDQSEARHSKTKQKSLFDRSTDKVESYIQSHNRDVDSREFTTKFQSMLKNQVRAHKAKKIGNVSHSVRGLKGRGDKPESPLQKMYLVEEVYKFDKSK